MKQPLVSQLSNNDLDLRIKQAYSMLEACSVCPRNCGVNRLNGELGVCGVGDLLMISSYGAHYGEEDVLVGSGGSGTIFLAGCSLRCVFCQNSEISHGMSGYEVSVEEFADIMMRLQRKGCHNINFVSPTHFTPQILRAVKVAKGQGLNVPLVYNCGGYESVETLKLLDGVIDIYMPDAKYADPDVARKLSGVESYPAVLKAALKEMHRQVGDMQIEDGLAVRGLLVRHLVLPNGLAGTEDLMRFIARELSPNTYVNIMEQYRPTFRAGAYPEINRRVTRDEYLAALSAAREQGLVLG